MRSENHPVYMIGVAAQLCGVHPQTLRQYERLGLVNPSRVGSKNRLYSESDIRRVRRVQRLTQEMGVNLAGVDLILRLLDDMEEMRKDLESQMAAYIEEAEKRIATMIAQNPSVPMRKDESLLPVPNFKPRRRVDL
ncbi:MAG TPA: helix-turn-helix transcriptional regulator [Fimbriimonas sp.]|nr:helix-turn-helix transcriptional regulator [Fimbriimonas sp.]